MKIALVLQGGGARGIFTSGILDELLLANIKIDKIFAVSAGALNTMNYLSRQFGRNHKAACLTFKSRDFVSIKNVITKRTFVDFNYYFNKLNEELPFDNNKYNTNPCKFCAVATSLTTGRARYFNKDEIDDFDQCIKASASLPLVSKIVKINNDFYLDGGDSDPVPYKKAIDEGYDKIIVITTRQLSFRKPINQPLRNLRLLHLAYNYNYPNYYNALKNSHINYNQEFDELTKLKDKVFIFEPKEDIDLKHLETNNDKLDYYYEMGREVFRANKEKLAKYLS